MTNELSTKKMTINDWVFRIKLPQKASRPSRVLLMLHGHLGNENAMWVLANPIPEDYAIVAPRAPLKLGDGQYSWHKISPQWPDLSTYNQLADELLLRVKTWQTENQLEVNQYDLMGFSQGAALAYALSILHPTKIRKIAALAGFIPETWKSQIADVSLKNQVFFISHGKQDEIVPISKAREAAQLIQTLGAQVTFCEAETGHKLSANCFNGLGDFFST